MLDIQIDHAEIEKELRQTANQLHMNLNDLVVNTLAEQFGKKHWGTMPMPIPMTASAHG